MHHLDDAGAAVLREAVDDAGAEEAVVGVRDLLARVRAVRRGEQVLLAQVVLAERLVERGLQLVRARKLVVLRDDPVLLLSERQRLDEPREVRAALEERAALDDEDVDGVDACAARAGRCSTPFSWWWLVRQFVESPRWRFAARGRQAGNTRVRTKAREKVSHLQCCAGSRGACSWSLTSAACSFAI